MYEKDKFDLSIKDNPRYSQEEKELIISATEEYDKSKYNCSDCGNDKGEYHREGCDIERCPICKLQLLTCDCNLRISMTNKKYLLNYMGEKFERKPIISLDEDFEG